MTLFLALLLSFSSAQAQKDNVVFNWAFGAMVNGGKDFRLITRDTTLNSGDYMKMVVELKSPCFVYVVYRDAKDAISILYPYDTKQFAGEFDQGKNYFIPAGRTWFQLDDTKGKERIYLIASNEKLTDLEKLIVDYENAIPVRKTAAADAVVNGIRDLRKRFTTFATTAERPISIGGNVRGAAETKARAGFPDLSNFMTEIRAVNFYSKTFTIDHK